MDMSLAVLIGGVLAFMVFAGMVAQIYIESMKIGLDVIRLVLLRHPPGHGELQPVRIGTESSPAEKKVIAATESLFRQAEQGQTG